MKPSTIARKCTEMGVDFMVGYAARMRYLKGEIAFLNNYRPSNATNNKYKKLLIAGYRKEMDALVSFANRRDNFRRFPEEMLDLARNYPIHRLIQFNENGFAKSPCHPDDNMSLKDYGSFAYCFACERVINAIDYLTEFRQMTFREAVFILTQLDELN